MRGRVGAPLVLMAMVPAAVSLHAQSAVPLSGEWSLVTAADSLGSTRRLRVMVDREGGREVLRVIRAAADRERTGVYRIGMVHDVTRGVAGGGTSRLEYVASWDGEHLLLKWASYPAEGAGPWRRVQEDWSFDVAGRLVIAVTSEGEGLAPRSSHRVYQRSTP